MHSRQLRIFAHQTYNHGVNLRSATLSTLPVLSTEVVVRTHMHGRAMLVRGSAMLEPAETSLRAELLLAGHSLVGAASLGKTLTLALAASPVAAARARRSTARSWDDLLAVAAPWQLDTADELDRVLAN